MKKMLLVAIFAGGLVGNISAAMLTLKNLKDDLIIYQIKWGGEWKASKYLDPGKTLKLRVVNMGITKIRYKKVTGRPSRFAEYTEFKLRNVPWIIIEESKIGISESKTVSIE